MSDLREENGTLVCMVNVLMSYIKQKGISSVVLSVRSSVSCSSH